MTNSPPQNVRRSPRRHTPPGTNPVSSPHRRSPRSQPQSERPEATRRQLSMSNAEEDIEIIDLAPDGMSEIYTFLSTRNRTALRNIGKKWNRRGTGNKKEFLYRNLLYLLNAKRAGQDVLTILKENEACIFFEEFMKKAEDESCIFEKCPSEETIRTHLRLFGDPEDIATTAALSDSRNLDGESGSGSSNFSISEFARLFVMLRDEHVCKQALLRLTQDLKQADFDSGSTRDSFWQEIERRSNDHNLIYYQSFEGSVPEADSSAPSFCYRKFDALKTQLQNGRRAFTLVYANYCQSGQNDPEKWPEFLTIKNREYIAASKKCYIIFIACRLADNCGQDMFLLNATTKTFSGGSDEGPEDTASTGSSGNKRKRMSDDAFNSSMEKKWSSLEKFMEDTKLQGDQIQKSFAGNQQSLTNQFADVAERNSVLEIVTSVYKAYRDAVERKADEKLVRFLKDNYEKAMRKYEELQGE